MLKKIGMLLALFAIGGFCAAGVGCPAKKKDEPAATKPDDKPVDGETKTGEGDAENGGTEDPA